MRFRETDNDLYRNARQQLFLEALKDRLATSLSLFQIPQLIGALKQSVEIAGGGGRGKPTLSEIESYIGLGYNLKPGHLFRVNIQNLQPCGIANAQVCAIAERSSRRPSTSSCIPTSQSPTARTMPRSVSSQGAKAPRSSAPTSRRSC